MSLSVERIRDIDEYLIHRAKEAGASPLDKDIILKCLYENWETVNDDTAMQAQLIIDRENSEQAIDDKQVNRLQNRGYTITEPE